MSAPSLGATSDTAAGAKDRVAGGSGPKSTSGSSRRRSFGQTLRAGSGQTLEENPTGFPVRTRPDWVCEVLSPSNPRNDLVNKLHVYQRHGVGHYWLLDPDAAVLTVYRWQG